MSVCILCRHGLIQYLCQTLEYCWQPDVAVCLLESLQQLVTDYEGYAADLHYVKNSHTLIQPQHSWLSIILCPTVWNLLPVEL